MQIGSVGTSAKAQGMRHLVAPLFLGICLLLVGCGSGSPAKPVSEAERQALAAAAAAPPRLQAGEKIQVTVYNEASLTGAYQIDPGGMVSLPLAGTIKAAGLTQKELETGIEKQFISSGYLKDPKVTVGVSEFKPFYISGEVEHPGAYPYTGGLNVSSAIAIAGGTTYRASQSRILIQHPGKNNMREYDLSSPESAPIPILPGDIISVPRRYF